MHPHEQEDFPFFLFNIILAITKPVSDKSNVRAMTVGQFIRLSSFYAFFLKIFFMLPTIENLVGFTSRYKITASKINATAVKNPNSPYLANLPN